MLRQSIAQKDTVILCLALTEGGLFPANYFNQLKHLQIVQCYIIPLEIEQK